MTLEDFTEGKEFTTLDLEIKDFFRYTGSNVVWQVIGIDQYALRIGSRKTTRTVYLNNNYKGKDFNATYGDRRVILLHPIKDKTKGRN